MDQSETDYSQGVIEMFENVFDSSEELSILTLVSPDVVVVSDGETEVSVSKGTEENEAFIEVNGQINTAVTDGSRRTESVLQALHMINNSYEGNLEETALNL